MNRLSDAYEEAIETHGQEAADRAAQTSIEVFNTTAIAGMECKMCEDEQFAAFVVALDE